MSELTGTLPKALLLLEYMALRQKDVSFKDLKSHSGFAANVLSRLLKTFIDKDYLRKDADSGFYSLSKSTHKLCENVLGRRSKSDLIQPYLDGLAVSLQESTAYFDFDDEWVTLLAKSEVANSYHYLDVNSRDVHSPINGFFFTCLPFIDQDLVQVILKSRDDHFNLKKEDLIKSFEKIRDQGYHISREVIHRSQVTRISAPVFEGDSVKLAGALGVTIISHDLAEVDMKSMIKTVKRTAQNASKSIWSS